MSVSYPAYTIPRQEVGDHVNAWVKTLEEPAVEEVPTPDLLSPTNPVPEFMESLDLASVETPHTLEPDLMHGDKLEMWDGERVEFFLFREKILDSPYNGNVYPGPTIRVPRGVIFHAKVNGHGGSKHSIHWHGIEPTPMNDGVGHCSFVVGDYTYQWQPNFIGTYLYHCHKNTALHFKAGLYGALIVEPPDAFAEGPGLKPGGYPRRTAANLGRFTQFPGFVGGSLESGDPHAMTVPYDVEALWAIDDISSTWMENMDDPSATLPEVGSIPGVNDRFNKGDLHDYNPNYFFVTGIGFPGRVGETVDLPRGATMPAAYNSGVSGMQIPVDAGVDKTVLIRIVSAAYTHIKVSFPIDVVVIAYDGRALGVPPYDRYNRPFVLRAGRALELGTAERRDVLLRSSIAVNSFAEVQYFTHPRGRALFTGRIPITIDDTGADTDG